VTTGTSETEGLTLGTSKSRTAGMSETIQKRALITPDEIGQVFARIDDKTQVGYPGLALVVISGARPLALVRVNYFEDYKFIGLFDPPPDFPFTAQKELCVDGSQMRLSLAEYGLKVGAWSVTPGSIAASNDGAASIVSGEGKDAAYIRVPRAGLISAVQVSGEVDIPAGPLFSLRYYEDGAALVDPFAELRALCASIAKQREDDKRMAEERKRRRKLALIGAAACVALVIVIAGIAHLRSGSTSAPGAEPQSAATPRPASLANSPANRSAPTSSAPANSTGSDVSGASGPPERSNSLPSQSAIMIGKIDVSRFVGVRADDTPAQVVALYGQPFSESKYGNRAQYFGPGPAQMYVNYINDRVASVTVEGGAEGFVRSHIGNDPLLDLLGHSEADAVAILGPPTGRSGNTVYWTLPTADPNEVAKSELRWGYKAVALAFEPDGGCGRIQVSW
jgi:hypothetical protein